MLVFAKTGSTGPLGGFPVACDTVSFPVSKILITPKAVPPRVRNFPGCCHHGKNSSQTEKS
jgi:hypothetical protein